MRLKLEWELWSNKELEERKLVEIAATCVVYHLCCVLLVLNWFMLIITNYCLTGSCSIVVFFVLNEVKWFFQQWSLDCFQHISGSWFCWAPERFCSIRSIMASQYSSYSWDVFSWNIKMQKAPQPELIDLDRMIGSFTVNLSKFLSVSLKMWGNIISTFPTTCTFVSVVLAAYSAKKFSAKTPELAGNSQVECHWLMTSLN